LNEEDTNINIGEDKKKVVKEDNFDSQTHDDSNSDSQ